MTRNALVEMQQISKSFGGVQALNSVNIDLHPGEVMGIVGHNGAGKSTLIKILSGALRADEGSILVQKKQVAMRSPRDARAHGIETIYQTLALADNLAAPANIFLGRELKGKFATLDETRMEEETAALLKRLKLKLPSLKAAVKELSGGQRQAIAISRAIYFNAQVLIMDEPTAALGPQETAQVGELIKQLKAEGIGIFLISHDLHDVFDLCDRISVLHQGQLVKTVRKEDVTKDEVLGMIIMGKQEKSVTEKGGKSF